MRGRIFLFLFLPVTFTITLRAQGPIVDPVMEMLHSRGEVYVSMNTGRLKAAAYLPKGVSIDRISGDSVFLYFHPSDTSFIMAHRQEISLLVPPSQKTIPLMATSIDQVLNGNAYPTWQQYLDIMKYFADTWPEICTIDTIGRSALGRLLLAADINTGHYQRNEVPEILYTSTIHGDEVVGYSLMLRLINLLLTENDNPEIHNVLQDKILLINPVSNPDGTYHQSDTSVFGAIRANASLVDLNRNYPDPQDGDHPDGHNWQPENVAMMEYMQQNLPNLSANFHGGSEVFNYPFDTWYYLHADDTWFKFLGREYADTAHQVSSVYMSDLNNGITNGFAWYEVNGGRQDYVTWFLHGREVTIELSHEKMPAANTLNSYWEMNRQSLLNYISQAGYGIEGHVTDAVTGLPVEATISIPGYDKLNSEVTSRTNGTFFRYLYAGSYQLNLTAGGYETDSVNTVVGNYDRTLLDVRLQPEKSIIPYSASTDPNPFSDQFSLIVQSNDEDLIYSRIYDLRGSLLYEKSFLMERGSNTFEIMPGLPAPGLYILKLSSVKFSYTLKIVRVL